MKKLIISILTILVCFNTFGQTFPQKTTTGAVQIEQSNLGAFEAQKGIKGGTFADTTAANAVSYMKNTAFLIIHTSLDNNTWYRSNDVTRWVLFNSGGGSNCPGTALINGSITWSGVGYVFNATALDYTIICGTYHSAATTLTNSTPDPSLPRWDVFYGDINNNVGILTGTPSATPIKPQVNALTQIEVTSVYVPAGSTTPSGQAITMIYNEGIEWSIAASATVNPTYATNPCFGSVSCLVSGATDGQFVSWQNGSVLDLSDYPYTKLLLKPNGAFPSLSNTFLTVTYYNSATAVSSSFQIASGTYGFDASSTSCQLIVLPNYLLTYSIPVNFDKIYFSISNAPSSFQLDRIYLLSGAVIPPTPGQQAWFDRGNINTDPDINYMGTGDSVNHVWGTNGQARAIMPANGLQLIAYEDTAKNILAWDTTTKKLYRAKMPTAYGISPIVVQRVAGTTFLSCPTCNTGAAGWSLTGNSGTVAGTNFIGTTDDVDLIIKRNSIKSGIIGFNTSFGLRSLLVNTGFDNTAFGLDALSSNLGGGQNSAFGSSSMLFNTTGSENMAIGTNSLLNNVVGNYNTAVGMQALYGNTAFDNTAIGHDALFNKVTGSSNIAIGSNAARFISGGVTQLTASDSSIYIGFNTKALSNSQTNQIVIGTQTTGLGSNTTIIGNANTTLTKLFGTLQIPNTTVAPGTQALRIDASGNVTRADTSAGGGSLPSTPNRGVFIDADGTPMVSDSFVVDQAAASITLQYNLGIGTTPTVGLEVNKDIKLGSTSGSYGTGIKTDATAGTTTAGDWGGIGNSTITTWNDNAQTITSSAINGWTHTGNFGINATPTADQLLVVNDGFNNQLEIDKTNFTTNLLVTDETASASLKIIGNSGAAYFRLRSNDGVNGIEIKGDAVANTLTLTAGSTAVNGNLTLDNTLGAGLLTSGTQTRLGDIANIANSTTLIVDDGGESYILNKLGGTGTRAVVADASGVLSTVAGGLLSGTYTPTLSNTTNVTSSTPIICHYTRVGNEVTVTGSVSVVTTLAVNTVLGISLPIASNFAATTDAAGVGQASTAIGTNAIVQGNASTDIAELRFIGLSVSGSGTLFFTFTYTVI